MKSGLKRFVALISLSVFGACQLAVAQDNINSRALEDLKAFIAKAEEGDRLFSEKKYAEAAAALGAAHDLYRRASKRDSGVSDFKVGVKPGAFATIRYYGYEYSSGSRLKENQSGKLEPRAVELKNAIGKMWEDAAILAGFEKVPNTFFDEPSMDELTQQRFDTILEFVYDDVRRADLPVKDHEWQDLVHDIRRSKILADYALKKFPEWKTGNPGWAGIDRTGNQAMADINAKSAEAEAEYAKIVADFKKAAPSGAKFWMDVKIEDLDKAIASVKQSGWVSWNLARDIFIDKTYVSAIRKDLSKSYADEGKTMPAEAMKPIEDRVAALKAAMEQTATKWKFPAGPKNAAFESKASGWVKSRFPGATVLRTALDTGAWVITKHENGIPSYRSMGIMVLAKIPGQKHPWLMFGYVRQTYAGGGTYGSTGPFGEPYDIRMQAGG